MPRMYLSASELAEEYGIAYQEALALAKTRKLPGYARGRNYRFNAVGVRRAWESGEFDRLLTEIYGRD